MLTSEMNSALTVPSSNKKTGPIAVSTTSRLSCPKGCAFHGEDGGCYADAGYYTRTHWDEVTAGKRGVPPLDFIKQVYDLPSCELFRHNVAGDLWHEPNTIDIIHQDSAHNFETITAEFEAWSKKLKVGGYWIIDDCDWVEAKEAYAQIEGYGMELFEDHEKWAIYKKVK